MATGVGRRTGINKILTAQKEVGAKEQQRLKNPLFVPMRDSIEIGLVDDEVLIWQ